MAILALSHQRRATSVGEQSKTCTLAEGTSLKIPSICKIPSAEALAESRDKESQPLFLVRNSATHKTTFFQQLHVSDFLKGTRQAGSVIFKEKQVFYFTNPRYPCKCAQTLPFIPVMMEKENLNFSLLSDLYVTFNYPFNDFETDFLQILNKSHISVHFIFNSLISHATPKKMHLS